MRNQILLKTEDPWLTVLLLMNQTPKIPRRGRRLLGKGLKFLFWRPSVVRNHLTHLATRKAMLNLKAHLSPILKLKWLHQALPRARTARMPRSHVQLSLWSQRRRGRQVWVLENPSPPSYPQNTNQGSCQWKVMYNLNLVIVHSVLDETWC